MSDRLVLYKDNLSPSISYQFTINGNPVDLAGATVGFKMRPVGSANLTVNSPAVITASSTGEVRYDPVAADLDTAGDYLGWFTVEFSNGNNQDTPEFLIEVADHSQQTHAYVELERVKSSIELTGTQFADDDLENLIVTASRVIDDMTGRRFWLDEDDQQQHIYSPNGLTTIRIDDLASFTGLFTAADGINYDDEWELGTDFVFEPRSAAVDGRPYELLRRLPYANFYFPRFDGSILLVGQFGWQTVPQAIQDATALMAVKLTKRLREAPFGISQIGPDGAVVRAAARDPELMAMLHPYTKRRLLV